MCIDTATSTIEIVNEPVYSFDSADNSRNYPFARNLAGNSGPSSIHGVLLNGDPIAVFGNSGGATGVHEHSAVYVNALLYLAIGDRVICIRPRPFEFIWQLRVDVATCFGVYFHEQRDLFLSHGELEISRFTKEGTTIWRQSGADIFTEGFRLLPNWVEAADFNGEIYRFDYSSGAEYE